MGGFLCTRPLQPLLSCQKILYLVSNRREVDERFTTKRWRLLIVLVTFSRVQTTLQLTFRVHRSLVVKT